MKIVLALALLIVIAKANPSEDARVEEQEEMLEPAVEGSNRYKCKSEETHLFGVGTNGAPYWTVPNGSWSRLSSGGWVSRIIIHGDTIYGIGKNKAIYSTSVHGGPNWGTQITTGSVTDLAYWNGRLYGVGTNGGVYWTVPNGSWSKLSSGGWVSRIIIHGDTIYGIGRNKAIYSTSVHGGPNWGSPITTGSVIDLAYWNGRLYGVGTIGGVYWTVPNGSWRKLSGGGWVSRIIIHGGTIYGIGSNKAIYSRSACVHGGSWTKITHGDVVDLAYWIGNRD